MKVKEQSQLQSLKNTFERENIQSHYKVLGYEIDLYFHEDKLTVEIDEKYHQDRDINLEIERQKALEKELSCIFVRINPDKEVFKISKAQNEIFRHVKESIKKSTEELTEISLVDELSNRLLKLEFKSNHSIKSKCFKHVVEKILPTL